MRRHFPGFLTFASNRLIWKRRSLRTATTFSACDTKVAFSRRSRKAAREVISISAPVWIIVGMTRRGGGAAVQRGLALLSAVVVESGSCW